MGGARPKLAYLAPEIPALSATFVYREILGLQRLGYKVLPISVHRPQSPAQEDSAQALAKDCIYLCEQSFGKNLAACLEQLFFHPLLFFDACFSLLGDILKTGLIRRQSFKLCYQFWRSFLVAKCLRTNRIDHLHIHFAHVPTQIGMYAAMLVDIPFTFTSHANDLFERPLLLKSKAKRSLAAVTISEFNKNFLLAQGIEVNKVRIVRCGVDSHELAKSLESSAKHGVVRIGTLGRMVEKKGMDILIQALGSLHRQGMRFDLELAGDGPLRESLAEWVDDCGLAECTKFVGALSHEQVPHWMGKLDLFVLACHADQNGAQDGIPVVLMEAMGLGVPVISTKISGIPELIVDGKTGSLALPQDVSSLQEKIALALQNRESTRQWAAAGRQYIEEEFDTEVNLQRLVTIFSGGYHVRGEKAYRRHLAPAR